MSNVVDCVAFYGALRRAGSRVPGFVSSWEVDHSGGDVR